ncbi:MAG: hypothetical protein HN931_01140 [Desulfobacterales bacterium]|jgi:glycosyltransferase involved in cell wall biosynthesis|nr:hypothetical protein [Desulfobacteraceae bacterium]MBT4363538.1 hypothetical protein [Desulfobacteraceae bacterium]MBT7084761.1 hypothetical protein [Desulfobacterales bacterium]
MKIAFVHYHLIPGGVTTVINQQINAVKDDCEILVLTGEMPEAPYPEYIKHIPGISYDKTGNTYCDPKKTAEQIYGTIKSTWKDGCDVLHIHNPTLSKNRGFLNILKSLQNMGINLFLQIHDFAEDGRPLSYYNGEEYVSDCHYGVINSRDYNILKESGLKEDGLHKTFNMVNTFNFNSDMTKKKKIVLYPVRAIRRKNIGEAILLSLFFKNREKLAITLPPNSESDIASYNDWKIFTRKNKLNVEFEASQKYGFENLVRTSSFFITTSITEGFGFSFLEPWTAGKYLWGRRLPEICCDFENRGIHLGHLYSEILVPIELLGGDLFYSKWKSAFEENLRLFESVIDKKDIEKSFIEINESKVIDFGLLDESSQKRLICNVLADKKNYNILKALNPHIELPGNDSYHNQSDILTNNRNAVEKFYNKENYRDSLLKIYKKVINTPVNHKIKKDVLLLSFLTPRNFSLLKWRKYDEN